MSQSTQFEGKLSSSPEQEKRKTMYGNYQYSLTEEEQSAIQIYLRQIPEEFHNSIWRKLHELTYAEDWTEEPKFLLLAMRD